MNDRQLRYAIKVRDELSFSRAAERLLISQPSISEQVRALEAELGFALFRRAGRGVEVTQAGRIFLHQAEEALVSLIGLNDLGRQLRRGPTCRFSVGMSPGIIQVIVPVVAEALRPILPKVQLSMATAMTPQLQRLVLQQVLDVGISVQVTPRSAHPALVWETTAAIDIALFVPPQHRLASTRKVVNLVDIADEPIVMSEPTLGYGALVQSMFSDRGLQPNIVSIADQTNTVKMMIRSGIGIGILPTITAATEVELGQLVQLQLRPARAVSLCLIRPARKLDPTVETAIREISSALATYDWNAGQKVRRKR